MKIAITCADLVFPDNIKIFSNGHHFNVLLWYHFFEKCQYDVIFISDRMETGTITNNNHIYSFINYKKWFEDETLLIKENIDCLFTAGLTDSGLCSLVKKHNIKRIYSMMGNNYVNDIDTVIYEKNYNTSVIRDAFDEIWISPHFGYSIEYYKIRYGLENIHIGPYIWADTLVKNHKSLEYKSKTKLTVAICEANISDKKNCMIPLCICEKGEQYIEFVRCYCTDKLRENSFFKSFASNLNLHKNKKIVFNNRNTIIDILSKCDCVISTTQEWDLNYVFLECFYFGIPLIHNSKMLEEYGYYYPDLDINKAVEQIKIVFNTHDTKLYIEKHKPLLHKYSMDNTYYQEWVKNRLINHDKKLLMLENNTMTEQQIKSSLSYQFIVITASNERKQLMEEQFSALNSPVDVHYLDASTPLNSQDYLKDCGKEEREYGVLCCTRSHIRALEYASQNKDKYKYSIILEDDVAFLKEGFLSKIEEVMGNWNKYDTHKMVSIGWVPCANYETYTKFDETLSNDTIKIITDQYFPGMQGYMVKNDDIPYMDSLVQPTYIEMDKKVKALDRYKVLATHFGEIQNTMLADVLINHLFRQAIVFPPLMIERDIPSMLGHNNINDYWANYFKGHETERDKYRLSIIKYQFIVICGSTERKQLMEQQFTALNSHVDVHYLEASTPSNSQDYLKNCGKDTSKYGVLCCARSHIRSLEYASLNKTKYEYSIILEDDVAFYKDNFLKLINEILSNWKEYNEHKMISIGWVPTYGNYTNFINMNTAYKKLTTVLDTKIIGKYSWGTQGYIVKNNDIPYLQYLLQPTFVELYSKIHSDKNIVSILQNSSGADCKIMEIDNYLSRLFKQAFVFPPLMIERDIPSMLGHNNINNHWVNYFKGHETERDKYRLSTKKTTLEIVDKLVENEKRPLDTQYQQFNNSRKIKCLWLRYIDDKSSWYTDTTKLWGPDVEAEYIVDILTNDGNKDNIEFLSVPSNFNVSLIKNVDVIAYSSNRYNVDYISKLVDILKPKALIHLSDEFCERPQYKEVFDKVRLVYRQYKFPNKNEYSDEINDTSIKYLPLGYHSWGKKYIRGQPILPYQRTYKWCFSGSVKNERTSQIEKLSQLTPYFCKNTNAFETTEMFRNSLFAFCPTGWSNSESSRIYEAMYNGCIPIIVGDKDKDKHNLEYFKNMFEIPLPCYFVYSIDEALFIIQSTGNDELIKIQEHCLQWVQNIGDKIRHEIISKCHTENNLHNNSTEPRNVFLYWVGKEYKLISILRNLIYLHSTNGKGYKVNLITDKNISDYIKNIPDYFSTLCPAHQADFVRVNVICDYGGIWLDSDTIVLQSLDSLFDFIKSGDGFFIKENNTILWNGIFGSKANTPLMVEWKKQMINLLDVKMGKIGWTDIGNNMLQNIYNNKTTSFFDNYNIFNGLNNLYPVGWQNCVTEFIEKPYENYKTIIREYQPLVVLVNSVYKKLEYKTEKEILEGNMPVNYFINKSFDNMKLIDYDFIEIGTSNFDTLIQSADDNTVGISVDAVKYYIDKLPDKLNCKKINVAISNINSTLDVYYIPENIIEQYNLPYWFKGCNCINNYHPLHIHHNVSHLCKIDKVNVITTDELFYQNNVRNVKYLKIDTEGHDTIILKQLFLYIKYLPIVCYPNKILFETNEHSSSKEVDEVIQLYCSIGYKLESRGYDTVLIL